MKSLSQWLPLRCPPQNNMIAIQIYFSEFYCEGSWVAYTINNRHRMFLIKKSNWWPLDPSISSRTCLVVCYPMNWPLEISFFRINNKPNAPFPTFYYWMLTDFLILLRLEVASLKTVPSTVMKVLVRNKNLVTDTSIWNTWHHGENELFNHLY